MAVPVLDQKAQRRERARVLATEVVDECRTQLMMRFRFLDRALWRMPIEAVQVQARYPLATDGSSVYVCAEDEVLRARASFDEAVRDYLHLVLHCVFRHPFAQARPRSDAWGLACDVMAESVALELSGERFPSPDDAARAEALSEMRAVLGPLSPAKLYSLFEAVVIMPESDASRGVDDSKLAAWRALFERDNHEAWPALSEVQASEEPGDVEELPRPGAGGDEGDDAVDAVRARTAGTDESSDAGEGAQEAESEPDARADAEDDGSCEGAGANAKEAAAADADDAADESAQGDGEGDDAASAERMRDEEQRARDAEDAWKDVAKQIEVDLQTYAESWGDEAAGLMSALTIANRRHVDYASFLRRFMTRAEELKINPDEFDYVFYTYGMKLYGNMPLIEPLEYAETQRIRDFVIAVDTSESCSGDLVRRFLEYTFDLFKEGEDFASRINVHIVQCDAKVQADTKVESLAQIPDLMDGFYVRGGGGTDFRPVFGYVERLRAQGELEHLQGLIYFTDGLGTFPETAPPYDTAFVFVDDGARTPPRVPPWAMRVVVDEESIRVHPRR